MKTARVCFLWHMHQPYYTDPVTGSASMPWVRLHAAKAYFDMAYLLDKFPAIHATFNFTPSLLLQLQEIGTGTVHDLFLEHAQRPAASLTPEEQAFLIRHYFSINWATMIRPYPRYHELLVKRGLEIDGQDLERLARQFTTQDLLDLQVWFNLAWFGYGAVHRHPRLAALRAKNRGFTEEEKQEVLALQRTSVQEIVPMYRRLAERSQIELTTTPFFHPILPLIIDTEYTRRARPDLPLPSRFHAPEDAEAQLRRAVEFHTDAFGRPPAGLWPSEGSVCPELIPMLPRVGLRWLATDEGVLARSIEATQRSWHRQTQLYRPYRSGPPGQEVPIVTSTTITGTAGAVTQNIDRRQVGTILTVTPRINDDNRVVMRVFPEISSLAQVIDLGNGQRGQALNVQQIETTIAANDGETVALGGLISDRDEKHQTGLPYLSNIPAVCSSALATSPDLASWRFRPDAFFVRMCRFIALPRLNFPFAVIVNRLAAPRWVFLLWVAMGLRLLAPCFGSGAGGRNGPLRGTRCLHALARGGSVAVEKIDRLCDRLDAPLCVIPHKVQGPVRQSPCAPPPLMIL